MDIRIAEAVPPDVPALVALLRELFTQDFSPDGARQERGLELLLRMPERARVARNEAGCAVGMVSAQLVVSTGTPSAWIKDRVVSSSYRRSGVGKSLLSQALAWAMGNGATRAQLLVDLDNVGAMEFYQHIGWKRTGAMRLMLSATI
ncbi:MAG: GNAT family N-acetyltransferase [Burkholderiales bacterium]